MKRITAVVCVAGLLYVSWWGNWLPLRLSYRYWKAFSEFHNTFDLNFKEQFHFLIEPGGYLGHSDILYTFYQNIALPMMFELSKRDPIAAKQIYEFALEADKRGNPTTLVTAMRQRASLRMLMFLSEPHMAYLDEAEGYLLEAARLSPNFPDVLLTLLELYRLKQDYPKQQMVKQRILELWPTSEVLVEYLNKMAY